MEGGVLPHQISGEGDTGHAPFPGFTTVCLVIAFSRQAGKGDLLRN